MFEVAAAVIDVALGAAAVLLVALRGRHRLGSASPLFCFLSLSVVSVLDLELIGQHAPRWLLLLGGAAAAAIFAAWYAMLFVKKRADGGDGEDDGGRGPGPGGRGPRPSPDAPGEPWWWAQFERDLRAYIAARERAARQRSWRTLVPRGWSRVASAAERYPGSTHTRGWSTR